MGSTWGRPRAKGGGGGANQANSVLGLSRVQNLSGTPVIDQDFGFAPPGGSIGNLVWHDLNNDGRYGVQVIDGKLDINGDGVISTADDGVYAHANVIDRRAHVDASLLRPPHQRNAGQQRARQPDRKFVHLRPPWVPRGAAGCQTRLSGVRRAADQNQS